MKSKVVSWLKSHRKMRVAIPSILAVAALLALAVPAYATGALEYLDVTGTYTISSRVLPRYMDNTRHPVAQFGDLIITTQTNKTISDATLEQMGADIALTGLVGPGTRPTITLYGTDSDGTYVQVLGKVRSDREGNVASISGRILGSVTSDGLRWDDSADGTAAISTADYHSEPISCLLTAGTLANPEALILHRPASRLKLSQLDTLTSTERNGLGFWFNLQDTKSPGPQIMLRFAPNDNDTMTYYGGGTSGLVDITIMPYQAPYTGDGEWTECNITSESGIVIYYGNDPTDYTSFGGTPVATLADVEAAINAETAMTANSDSCSNWVLTMVSIELWEGGARTCYIDDVTIAGQLYTLEPNSYYTGFRAIIQS